MLPMKGTAITVSGLLQLSQIVCFLRSIVVEVGDLSVGGAQLLQLLALGQVVNNLSGRVPND